MGLDLHDAVSALPDWWPLAATGLVLAALIATHLAARRSRWLSGIGPQAVVALGGVAVSVHGLWGFAGETAKLPPVLAVAFIAVFDAAEMTLLVMLYRAADPKAGWTRELRLMHRTTWTLVAFSAAMNAVHAPNWWSRPVLAAIPALATWLIELQLRAKLGTRANGEDGEEDTARPGPARLLALVWQHGWAALFALLGLDARSSSSAIARAAMAQKAAHRVYRLRTVLEAADVRQDASARAAERTRRRIVRRRRRAQKALDRAEVATDTGQALAVVRRLAALTRADEVALLDYTDPPAVLALIEGLAVTPAADRHAASVRAAEAEDARERAEAALREAETARQRAADELAAARTELEETTAQRERTSEQLRTLQREAEDARQRAADARREEQDARQRADASLAAVREQTGQAEHRAREVLEGIEQATVERRQALEELGSRAEEVRREVSAREQALRQLTSEVREALTLRDRLRGDLVPLSEGAPDAALSGEGPLFRSQAKQSGWQHYLAALAASGGQVEPAASELAERFGIDAGNARNWLRDFRTARAAQLAAQPRGDEALAEARVG
ncbi:hypothetical protein GCM10027091_01620 [Streptomyces daliensis]